MSQSSTTSDSVPGRKKKKKKKKRRGQPADSNANNERDKSDGSDIYCDPCKNVSGNTISAEMFCVNCSEYLCKPCSDYHTKLTATREHALQDKDSMPKNEKSGEKCHSHSDNVTICHAHPGNVIEYYCRSCDVTGCPVCLKSYHKTCARVEYMSSSVSKLKDGSEYKELDNTLQQLKTELTFNEEELKCNENKIEFFKETAQRAIEKQKTEVSKLLNDWERDILEVIEKMGKDKKTKLKSASEKLRNLTSEVKSIIDDLDEKEKHGGLLEFFVAMKRDHNLLPKLKHEFQVLQKENKITKYKFAPSKQMCEELKKCGALGSLTELSAEKKRQFTFKKAITVKSEQDSYSNWVSSVCVVSERIIVTADKGFLKVMNTATGKIMFILTVPKLPAGITKTTDREIAVTISKEKKVMFFSIADNGVLSFEREFEVDGECKGIAYTNGKLIVTFSDPWKVEILNLKGTVLKCFKQDMDEYKFLNNCNYVAVSKNIDIFYVSNNMEDRVTCMTFDGKVIAFYRDEIELREPWGMVIDENGSVFVFCGLSCNIHQLTDDCTKLQVLRERGPGPPCAVDYCRQSKKLYVARLAGEIINVYDLE